MMTNTVQHFTNLIDLSFSVQPKIGRNVSVVFRWEGKQVTITTLTKDEAEARALAPKKIAEWFQKNHISPPIKNTGSLSQAIERFLSTKYGFKKKNTVVEVRGALELLARHLSENWANTTAREFDDIAPKLRVGIAHKTWKNKLTILRKFWRWCVKEGLARVDATENQEMPPSALFGNRQDIWTDEYLESICALLKPDDAEAVMVMRWTGLDNSDIWALDKSHFIKDRKGNLSIVKLRAKAKSPKEVIRQPVCSAIKSIIAKRLKGNSSRLFPSIYTDGHVFGVCLWDRVKAAMDKAGIERMALKSLRHTFATYHIERDVPEDVLAGWMGHAPGSTILRRFYLHRRSTSRYMD